MHTHVSRPLGILFAMLFMVRLGKASTLAARALLDTDSGDGDNDADDQTTIHFFTPTPSGSPSASQPTSSAGFAFNTPTSLTVCGATTLSWSYAGDSTFTIYAIQNEGTGSSALTTQLTIIAGGQDTTTFNWLPINVPAGSYTLEAYVPSLEQIYYSKTFSVLAGSDTSCLTGSSSSSSSIGTSMSGTSAPVAGISTFAVTQSGISSSAGSFSSLPSISVGIEGSAAISGGGIAGIVIGALAFVGALIAVFILRRRSNSSTSLGAPRLGGLSEKQRSAGTVMSNNRRGTFSSIHSRPAQNDGPTFTSTTHYNLNDYSRGDHECGTSFIDMTD